MPTRLNNSEWEGCHHLRCRHLVPRPTHIQRRVVPYALKALDLALRMCLDPDDLVEFGHRVYRRISGLRLKTRRVGARIWPYLEGGRGDHLVLLHGFGADKDRFGSFLLRMGRGFHRVVPDIPGFGAHTQNWSARYDIDAQVRRLERFVDAVGLGRFHLMGISLGGYMAAYYAARNTERVRSLCLMDSVGFTSPVHADALRLFENDGSNIFLPVDGAQIQRLIDHLLYRPAKLPSTLKRYWLTQSLDLLSWRQKLLNDLLAGGIHLLDHAAGAVKAPTLVVWGADDRICHVTTVDTIMRLIENAQSYIIHGCGHIPLVEHPALTATIYKGFLRKISCGASRDLRKAPSRGKMPIP